VVTITGRANLMRFPVNGGKPVEITKGDQSIQRFASAGNTFALLISTPTNIGDLFVVGANGGEQRRITDVNAKLFSQLDIPAPEEIWYNSFDGKKIQAWVQKPLGFDATKKYPLILNIHGGPHTAYGWVFDHEFQWMAAKGYVVLYPNPRGSTSYGEDFGNIIQYKYPGDDYKDLMAGVDELIKRGYIDSTRLGVTGGSGGGVLTDWTVTQTNRFKAAVSQRDISDWAAFWYSADFWLYHPTWFKKPPFEDPKEYADRSAITFVDRIQTPMAFILGESDLRTPTQSGGEQLFRALKYLHRPTAMVRFPGESHELSRSGQPWHRIERLEAIVGWFDKYLLGKDVAIYRDVSGSNTVSASQ
jgi:dipeptidyl aminopeptidase/acylaminoacyl peptidase